LKSESLQPEASEQDSQSGIILELASTIEADTLESQTTTIKEACQLVESNLRNQFTNRFLQLIHETEFEFGFSNQADKYISDALNSYGPFAREWINDLFNKSFGSPFVLSAILRVMAHFDYEQMYPQGITMAAAAAGHTDAEVQECGVRCFESWENPESLTILRHLSFREDWLNKYLADVITALEDAESHGTSR